MPAMAATPAMPTTTMTEIRENVAEAFFGMGRPLLPRTHKQDSKFDNYPLVVNTIAEVDHGRQWAVELHAKDGWRGDRL